MDVFPRPRWSSRAAADAFPLRQPRLLLEGTWPTSLADSHAFALDDAIDGRFAALEREATELAIKLSTPSPNAGPAETTLAQAAWLWQLPLRYYLLRLLRVVAFFEVVAGRSSGTTRSLCFHPQQPSDESTGALLQSIASAYGWIYAEESGEGGQKTAAGRSSGRGQLRRACRLWAKVVLRGLSRFVPEVALPEGGDGPVLLRGNSALLDPVCRELLRQRVAACWAFDTYSLGCRWRWRGQGVGQWIVPATGRAELKLAGEMGGPGGVLPAHGVDLAPAVTRWWADICPLARAALAAQAAWHVQFAQRRPRALIVDEDQTPAARALIGAAKGHGIPTWVVQHGVPYGEFGFAPLAADAICAWGESSARRLQLLGIPRASIAVTGSPKQDEWSPVPSSTRNSGPLRVLLLATTTPRDDRPEPPVFHHTVATLRETLHDLRAALEIAAATLATRPVELWVKLHPRCAQDEAWRAPWRGARFRVRSVSGKLAPWVRRCDLVIGCCSSAGVEAAALGRPVIELQHQRSAELLVPAEWGLRGVARTREEIASLIVAIARNAPAETSPRRSVFYAGPEDARHPSTAAERIVNQVLSQTQAWRTCGEGGTIACREGAHVA